MGRVGCGGALVKRRWPCDRNRGRAQPAGPRAVSWFRSHGRATTTLPVDARAAAGGALETFKGVFGSTTPCEGGTVGTSSGVRTRANGASGQGGRAVWAHIRHSAGCRGWARNTM